MLIANERNESLAYRIRGEVTGWSVIRNLQVDEWDRPAINEKTPITGMEFEFPFWPAEQS